jgi:hypothetical protein
MPKKVLREEKRRREEEPLRRGNVPKKVFGGEKRTVSHSWLPQRGLDKEKRDDVSLLVA